MDKPSEIDIFATFPNLWSEETVIAGMLSKVQWQALAISDGLTPECFLSPQNEKIFKVILDLFEARGRSDVVSVTSELFERGELDEVGGKERMLYLHSVFPSKETFLDNLDRMIVGGRLRRFNDAFWEIRRDVFATDNKTLLERLKTFESGVGKLLTIVAGNHDTIFSADQLAELAEQPDRFVPTGISQLDEKVGGFKPGRVTIIAARPSHGKTSYALELTTRQSEAIIKAGDNGVVYYLSAEMSAEAIAHRLKSRAGTDSIRSLRIVVDSRARPTNAYVMGRVVAINAVTPVRLVVIDYLQYTGEKGENRRHSYDNFLAGMHELAKRIDCPVLVLAQLNREIERRGTDPEPQLADLKETGGIEEVAAMVQMLYHPWTHWFQRGQDQEDEPDQQTFKVFVRKNTHGPLGSVTLNFDRTTGRITDPMETARENGRIYTPPF